MLRFNSHLRDTGTPPIPEAHGWARRYTGALGPLIDLSQAVPGYPPHPALLEKLKDAAGTAAAARYGDIYGDDDLRAALATDIASRYGAAPTPNEIAITSGCNQAFVVTMMALAQAGDSVLLPTPWYFNHQMTLQMLGITARALPCQPENGFVPDPRDAEMLIDDSTRALVLVTPNNPTGAIYSRDTIAAFAALCARKKIWLVIDETYRDFLPADYGAPHHLFAEPHWGEHVISLYSFSKAYAIPGHRVGAILSGEALREQIGKVIDCVQICAPRAAQHALTWAIPHLTSWRDDNGREIEARAKLFRDAMAASPGWRLESIGAYFAYVAHPFPDISAREVAEALAAECGVLALPGPYFGPGQDGHLRLAFANVDGKALSALPERFNNFTLSHSMVRS